jgi:invasion protein IalB
MFSWRSAQRSCGERQLVDMAAQITAAYVASHSVTAAMTAKYVTEIHEALIRLADEQAPPERKFGLGKKLTLAGSLAVLIGLAGLGLTIDFGVPKGTSEKTPLASVSIGEEQEASSTARSITPLSSRLQHVTRDAVSAEPSGPLRFDDWDVFCASGKCSLRQQSQHSNGSASARISLEPGPEPGSLTGTMMLPFEVPLQSRITLQTGAGALDGPSSFRNCNAGGCILPINLNAGHVASLEKGILLQANATSDDGRTLSFFFSLKGFRAAYERVRAADASQASAP